MATWVQKGSPIIGSIGANRYVTALSADGTVMAIGGDNGSAGSVFVYEWSTDTETWNEIGNSIFGTRRINVLSKCISLSDDGATIAIGHVFDNHVRIYRRIGPSAWTQIGSAIQGEAAFDNFGISTSLSADGSIVAIGADSNDDNTIGSGHVRVYQYDTPLDVWTQIGNDIDGEGQGDQSGYSVSLSADGSTVAIGAQGNDGYDIYPPLGLSSNTTEITGYTVGSGTYIVSASVTGPSPTYAVYQAFDNQLNTQWGDGGGNYNAVTGLYISSTTTVDISGETISGEWIQIQLPTATNLYQIGITCTFGGARYVPRSFVIVGSNDGTNWKNIYEESDYIGWRSGDVSYFFVNSSDNYAYYRVIIRRVGASDNDGNSGQDWIMIDNIRLFSLPNSLNENEYGQTANRGHVRIFNWNEGNNVWVQKGNDIDGDQLGGGSGQSVSLSEDGSVVAIGSRFHDGNGNNSGQVKVYEWNASILSWVQKGNDIYGEVNSIAGYHVSLSGNGTRIAISAPNGVNGNVYDAFVRVYEWSTITTSWSQIGNDIEGVQYLGRGLALSRDGTTIAVGALNMPGDSASRGYVATYVFPFVEVFSSFTGATNYYTIPTLLDVSYTNAVDLSVNILDTPMTDTSGVAYIDNIEITGSVVRFSMEAFNTNNVKVTDFSNDPLKITLTLPNANPNGILYVYKLRTGTNTVLNPQPSGYPVLLTHQGDNVYTGQLVSLSDYVVVDSTVNQVLSNICFPADTPIKTDQGIFKIASLYREISNASNQYTINGKSIQTITKTVTYDNELVCFEANSISKGVPTERTIMSRNHKILKNGSLYPARMLVSSNLSDNTRKIYTIPYNGEPLYNVLLDSYEIMDVNGLACETLNPENETAKFFKIMRSMNNNPDFCKKFVEQYNKTLTSCIGH